MRVGPVVAVIAAASIAFSLSGFASSLGTQTKKLGAAKATLVRCDTDGVTVTRNLTASNVVSVTVGGIASACATGTLAVNVNNGIANSAGSAAVPAGGGSMTVTLATPVAMTDSQETDISITGP